MKPRTVTSLAALLALGLPTALSASASAAPVEQRRIATTTVQIALKGGATLRVELHLSTASSGAVLAVTTTRCAAAGCAMPVEYAGAVAGGSISATTVSAALTTTVGGRSLALAWSPSDQQGVMIGGLRGSGDDGGEAVSAYRGDPAKVSVRGADGTCQGTGAVGDEVSASDSAGGPAGVRPLSALHLPSRGQLTC